MNTHDEITVGVSTFEAIRRFDELDHKAVLERIAAVDLMSFQCGIEGVEFPFKSVEPVIAEVIVALFPAEGQMKNKVWAIKALRTKFGFGLKEAKDVTDWLDGSSNAAKLDTQQSKVLNMFIAAGFKPIPCPAVAPLTPIIRHVHVVTYKERGSLSDSWRNVTEVYVSGLEADRRCEALSNDEGYNDDVKAVCVGLNHYGS